MVYKYSNLAELLHASYSGLQMMAFTFSKKKSRYSGSCYAFRETIIKKYRAWEMHIGNLYYENINRLVFRRMLADIRAGKVDMVVCYKIDH